MPSTLYIEPLTMESYKTACPVMFLSDQAVLIKKIFSNWFGLIEQLIELYDDPATVRCHGSTLSN